MRTSDVYTYTTHRLVQLCAARRSVSGAERQGCLLGASWMLWQRRRGMLGGTLAVASRSLTGAVSRADVVAVGGPAE